MEDNELDLLRVVQTKQRDQGCLPKVTAVTDDAYGVHVESCLLDRAGDGIGRDHAGNGFEA